MTKKIKFVHIFWLFFYLLIIAFLLKTGFSYLDPDFGWHLKVGEEISLSGNVPHLNTYNYTVQGTWVDHEWLSNFLIYKIYINLGYPAVVGVFTGIIILVLILQAKYLPNKLKQEYYWLIAGMQLFGVLASLPHFGVRIQELALLFILSLLIIIDRFTASKRTNLLFLLPPLFYLWANLHASFLIGFFILFVWIGIKICELIVSKVRISDSVFDLSEVFSGMVLLKIFAWSIISFGATMATPYGFKLYSFLVGYSNSAYLNLIQEWLPQYSFPFIYAQLVYLAIGATAVILYIYNKSKEKKGIKMWKIFLTIVFIILSFKSRRHFPLFFVVSFPLIVEVFSSYISDVKVAFQNGLKILTIVCIIFLIIAKAQSIIIIRNPFSSFCENYPCKAIEYIKTQPNLYSKNLFNNYGWGGYMIWEQPERKLFIDGRLPQISFNGWSFIEEYYSFYKSPEIAKSNLEKYNIQLVLLSAKDRYQKPKKWERMVFAIKEEQVMPTNLLKDYLNSSKEWKNIYQDQTAVIYMRN